MNNQPCSSKQALAKDAKQLPNTSRRSSLRSARFSKIDKNSLISKKNSIITEVYQDDNKINDLLKFIDFDDGLLETQKLQKMSCADTESDDSLDAIIPKLKINQQKKLNKTKKSASKSDDDDDYEMPNKSLESDSESDVGRVTKNVRKKKTFFSSDEEVSDEDVVCSPKPKVLSKKPIPVTADSGSDEDCYNNMDSDIKKFFLNSMSSFEERERLIAEEEENPSTFFPEDSSDDEVKVESKAKSWHNNKTNFGTRNSARNVPNFIAGPVQNPTYSRTGLRQILDDSELAWETLEAKRQEGNREKLLSQKTEMMDKMFQENLNLNDKSNLHLDFDSARNEFISVDPKLVKSLKDYQREGVQFMYDVCFGGIDTMDQFLGSGCILAHCMGLGKTLQVSN